MVKNCGLSNDRTRREVGGQPLALQVMLRAQNQGLHLASDVLLQVNAIAKLGSGTAGMRDQTWA